MIIIALFTNVAFSLDTANITYMVVRTRGVNIVTMS